MRKRTLTMAIAVMLIAIVAVGGTLAWLVDKTGPVENTFTAGDVKITLAETTGTEYKMVPGNKITKDPKTTVLAGSEDSYLFVKVEKSANFDSFMTYGMADGWIALGDTYPGVYYREVVASNVDQAFPVIKDNEVQVLGTVTKEMLTAETFTKPTLTFTAYAIQKANMTGPADAWTKLNDQIDSATN